jgi:hypothetical protein
MYSLLYQLVMGAYQISKLLKVMVLVDWPIQKKKKFGNFALFHNKSFRTLHTPKQGLLKGFCDVSKIGDNPENNLAKFGYTPAMKAFF